MTELPPPVRRYLSLALGDSPAAPAAIAMRQRGRLRTRPDGGRWLSFRASHQASIRAAAFTWDARVRIAPLLYVRVLDSLADGVGAGSVQLQGLLGLTRDANHRPLNSGSLHRYLAEAVWYPWALLPHEGLRWTEGDARRACATLTSGDVCVSLDFSFGDDGLVSKIHTDARWGRFGGRYLQAPWEGHFADYARHDGVLVPARGEVGWYWAGRLATVWEGDILAWGPMRR